MRSAAAAQGAVPWPTVAITDTDECPVCGRAGRTGDVQLVVDGGPGRPRAAVCVPCAARLPGPKVAVAVALYIERTHLALPFAALPGPVRRRYSEGRATMARLVREGVA